MKQVHVAKHAPEARRVRGFLESNGIAAEVRGEFLTSGWGELPVDVCSVWIDDDRQFERAQALLVAFLRGDIAREFRDQRTVIFADYFDGDATFQYAMRVLIPGEFKVAPARAELMYQPTVQANTANMRLNILDKK